MIKKVAYWLGENRELNRLAREYISKYSQIPDYDVILFSDTKYIERAPCFPLYNMYDYDGLIVIDSIDKLIRMKELFSSNVIYYCWEDNWPLKMDFLDSLKLLDGVKVLARNDLESNKFKLTWGISPKANIYLPDPAELHNASI